MYGTYKVVLYNSNAQQFILDNIDAIATYNTAKRADYGKGKYYMKKILLQTILSTIFSADSAVR